jgi:hypothetical protein
MAPSYSVESINIVRGDTEFIIPMISICDIPISQFINHIGVYGHYGVGFNRDWGLKHKFNPVIYIQSGSILSKSILGITEFFYEQQKIQDEFNAVTKTEFKRWMGEQLLPVMQLMLYIKNYSGTYLRKKDGKKVSYRNYKYYDEREWRYIPDLLSNKVFTESNDYDDYIKTGGSSLLIKSALPVELDEIRYIILKDESDIEKLISELKSCGKFTILQTEKLCTKILTMDRIKEDY